MKRDSKERAGVSSKLAESLDRLRLLGSLGQELKQALCKNHPPALSS